jgi:hypothetical protein
MNYLALLAAMHKNQTRTFGSDYRDLMIAERNEPPQRTTRAHLTKTFAVH